MNCLLGESMWGVGKIIKTQKKFSNLTVARHSVAYHSSYDFAGMDSYGNSLRRKGNQFSERVKNS